MHSLLQLEAIRLRQVDGAFVYRSADADPTFKYHPLGSEGMYLAVPIAHRLAKRSRVALTDIADEALISISRSANPIFHETLAQSLHASGLSARITQEANSSWVVLCLVAVGMGLGIVGSAARWRQPSDIALLHLNEKALSYILAFVHRRDNESTVLARFLQTLGGVQRARASASAGGRNYGARTAGITIGR